MARSLGERCARGAVTAWFLAAAINELDLLLHARWALAGLMLLFFALLTAVFYVGALLTVTMLRCSYCEHRRFYHNGDFGGGACWIHTCQCPGPVHVPSARVAGQGGRDA